LAVGGPAATVAAQTPAAGMAPGEAASGAGAREDPALRAAIQALLAQVEICWRTLDTPALEGLWDTSHPPLYVAEESTEIHTTFPSLRRYWTNARDSTVKMGLTLGRPDIVPLSGELVTAMYPLHWECLLKGETAPIGGDNRAFSVLRRVNGAWRFTQYVEAPLAPLVYLHQLYERSVSKDFGR
jgi:hypothetical protein